MIKSPCIGICRLGPDGFCLGCLRSVQEIGSWSKKTDAERAEILKQLPQRRAGDGCETLTDQLGRVMPKPDRINRIVSLVPSMTQTLYDLGLEDKVVGHSSYCPRGVVQKLNVGGTKNPRRDKILSLAPDLVLANKEENNKGDILALAERIPVWVSDVKTLSAGTAMISAFGEIFDCRPRATDLVQDIDGLRQLVTSKFSGRCVYLIWQEPLMTIGGDTFIHSWLDYLGFANLCGDKQRYPEVAMEWLLKEAPEVLLLPDEPFEFTDCEKEKFAKKMPSTKIVLVDGAAFSWFGSHQLQAAQYFADLKID